MLACQQAQRRWWTWCTSYLLHISASHVSTAIASVLLLHRLKFVLPALTCNIIMEVYSIFILFLWDCPVHLSTLQCIVGEWWSVFGASVRPKIVNEWTAWGNEMQHQGPEGSSFSLSAQILAGCICLCPPLYGSWWIVKRIWLMVRVFFYSSSFLLSSFFRSPLAKWQS